jgi:hypothetical protein
MASLLRGPHLRVAGVASDVDNVAASDAGARGAGERAGDSDCRYPVVSRNWGTKPRQRFSRGRHRPVQAPAEHTKAQAGPSSQVPSALQDCGAFPLRCTCPGVQLPTQAHLRAQRRTACAALPLAVDIAGLGKVLETPLLARHAQTGAIAKLANEGTGLSDGQVPEA